MTIGYLVSLTVYSLLIAMIATHGVRYLRRRHRMRMTQIDDAIESERARFREERMKWAVEDARYRNQLTDAESPSPLLTTSDN
jgi:hypothetical protein